MSSVSAEYKPPRVLWRAIGSKDYIVQMSPQDYKYYFSKQQKSQHDRDIVWSGSSDEYLTLLDDMIAQDASKRA